jgi:hypothetical protein
MRACVAVSAIRYSQAGQQIRMLVSFVVVWEHLLCFLGWCNLLHTTPTQTGFACMQFTSRPRPTTFSSCCHCCHPFLFQQDDARLTCLDNSGVACGDPVPGSLAPPLNSLAFIQLNGTGSQNYTCRDGRFYFLGATIDLYDASSGEFAGEDGADPSKKRKEKKRNKKRLCSPARGAGTWIKGALGPAGQASLVAEHPNAA